MKPKRLYHGSMNKLRGHKLVPKKAKDIEKRAANILKGIYATGIRDAAIAMAIISGKSVRRSSLSFYPPRGIVHEGWPRRKYFYLYTLPSDTFKEIPKGSTQWVSLEPVKPIKIERLRVSDYIHLIRKATRKEEKEWKGKYKNKTKKKGF